MPDSTVTGEEAASLSGEQAPAGNVTSDADGVLAGEANAVQSRAINLETASQAVKDAAARSGGEVPMAAPKGGEGTNTIAFEAPIPALEPPPSPVEYRVAPIAPEQIERASLGTRPTLEALQSAERVRVQTVDPRSAGIYVAGVWVGREPTEVNLAEVKARGPAHLAALQSDLRIEVEAV